MNKIKICAVITQPDSEAVKKAAADADLFELRIDLVGKGWEQLASSLRKPWIAANRRASDGGKWRGSEQERTAQLLHAADLGSDIVDIELDAPGLKEFMPQLKGRARCIISHHDWKGTPPADKLAEIIRRQIAAGADICKVVTNAAGLQDNLTVLSLLPMFPAARIVAFAMGAEGVISRILSPLAGAYFTYASIPGLSGSAPGQITVEALRNIYGLIA